MGYGYKTPLIQLNEDKTYIVVWKNGVNKPSGRFVKRTILYKVCKAYGCKLYEECYKMAEEIECPEAWGLTKGKGRKAY